MHQARSEHEENLARIRSLKRDLMVRKLEKSRAKKMALVQLEQDLEFQIAKRPARVSGVHVDGISYTKDHLVENIISKILKASNFEEVMMLTKTAHGKMKKLGCFAKVDATIDTDDNGDFEIYFDVEEMPWTYVHGSSETGDNEALLLLRGGVPNITGRGERLESSVKIGTAGTQNVQLDYKLPIRCNLLLSDSLMCNSFFNASLFRHYKRAPWSGLDWTHHGASVMFSLSPQPWLSQVVKWEGIWRQAQALAHPSPGFLARTCCGHSLKSSLTHMITVNTLDDVAVPKKGVHGVFAQELAGLGFGNVAFFKTIGKAAGFAELSPHISVGATCAAGFLSKIQMSESAFSNISNEPLAPSPCDRFTLGGPLIMRGFLNNRLGPNDDGNHLGGNAFWRVALHVLTKLPSIRGNNWLANNVRGHCFIEAGGLADVGTSSIFKWLDSNLIPARISSGVGLVIKLGPYGRAELNYTAPLKFGLSDSIHHGLQFGIGVNYS